MKTKYPVEVLKSEYIRIKEKIGIPPRSSEWKKETKISTNYIYKEWGSWGSFVNSFGDNLGCYKIQKKIKTFAHTEYDKKRFTNLNTIKNKIKKGLDIFNRNIFFEKRDLDQTFPKYILKNKNKFIKWIV
jgi:hypothetical protein